MSSFGFVMAAAGRAPTLSERMIATGGRSSGFDYLRIILALAVAIDHLPYVTYGGEFTTVFFAQTRVRPLIDTILPMFFALSGFLVAGSFERCRTVTGFLGLRMIRIFPALAVEVLLSALILGPLLTTVSLGQYFGSIELRQYFLNIIGEVHFYLEGVFLDNPHPRVVNAQLWTIPFELLCYLLLTGLVLIGLKRRSLIAPAAATGLMALYVIAFGIRHHWNAELIYPAPGTPRVGIAMVWAFLWGVCIYLYRDRIPWSRGLFVACAAAAVGALMLKGYFYYLVPIPLAYATIYLGLTDPRRAFFLKGADYSYGVYLYHFVIMQTVAVFAPRHWLSHVLISLPLTIAFAALSWHLVEKQAMRLRHPLMAADRGTRDAVPLMISAAVGAGLVGFVLATHVHEFFFPG